MTSLIVRIDYVSGNGLEMMLLEEMVSYDFSKPGKATVTVEYDGMVATYEVTVLESPTTEESTTEPVGSIQESTEPTEPTEAPTETEPASDDLVPEPAIQNGCGAVLPAGLLVLALIAGAFIKKED